MGSSLGHTLGGFWFWMLGFLAGSNGIVGGL